MPGLDTTAVDAARARMFEAFGAKHQQLTSDHIRGIYHPSVLEADRAIALRAVYDYQQEVLKFGVATNNLPLQQQAELMMTRIGEQMRSVVGNAPIDGPGGLKELMLAVAGGEVVDDLGLPDELKYAMYAGAVGKVMRGRSGGGGGGGGRTGLVGRMFRRGGGYGLGRIAAGPGAMAAAATRGAATEGGYSGVNALLGAGDVTSAVGNNRARMRRALAEAISGPASRVAAAKGPNLLHNLDLRMDDDTERPAAKSDREAVERLRKDVARAVANPRVLAERLDERLAPMRTINDKLADKSRDKLTGAYMHLNAALPRDPGSNYTFGRSNWEMDELAVFEAAETIRGTITPMLVIEDALAGRPVSIQAARAVQQVWPEILADTKMDLLEAVAGNEDKVPYETVVQASTLYGQAFDATMQPEFRAFMKNMQLSEQESQVPAGPPQGGGGGTYDEDLTMSQRLQK